MGVALSNSPKGVVLSGSLVHSKCGISPPLSLVRNIQFYVFQFFTQVFSIRVSSIFVVCWSGSCFWTAVDMVSFLVLFVSTMLVVRSELGVRGSENLMQ